MNRTTLRKSIESDLLDRYGPILSGEALWRSLGYTSKDAFRQAQSRGTVPIHVFPIENRRGKFGLTKDVAKFLADQRYKTAKRAK